MCGVWLGPIWCGSVGLVWRWCGYAGRLDVATVWCYCGYMRDEVVRTRVTGEQKDLWERAAALEKRSLSDWMRLRLDRDAQVVLLRERVGEDGALVEAGEVTSAAGSGGVDAEASAAVGPRESARVGQPAPASTSAFDPRCSNASSHIEGKLCRWCGGVR